MKRHDRQKVMPEQTRDGSQQRAFIQSAFVQILWRSSLRTFSVARRASPFNSLFCIKGGWCKRKTSFFIVVLPVPSLPKSRLS